MRAEVLLVDVSSGKQLGDSVRHVDDMEIVCLGLSQAGQLHDRKFFFIDAHHDLYLVRCAQPQPSKLASVRPSPRRSRPRGQSAQVAAGHSTSGWLRRW